jgi:3-dehydroquinate synthase
VNYLGHKSYIGCFHPPEATLIDPASLRTLPARHLRSGLAEMIKIALVRDARLFDLIEAEAPRLVRFPDSRHRALRRSRPCGRARRGDARRARAEPLRET